MSRQPGQLDALVERMRVAQTRQEAFTLTPAECGMVVGAVMQARQLATVLLSRVDSLLERFK